MSGQEQTDTALILASASPVRRKILQDAGVPVRCQAAAIDEEALKESLRAENTAVDELALALAEMKARHVSQSHSGAFVIGADQILLSETRQFDKPADLAEARAHLLALRGRVHYLVTAVCVVKDGATLWHHIDRPALRMRAFSDDFLAAYLQHADNDVCASVGAYAVEGRGIQLFETIKGDYFSIMGLPLLALLNFLRQHDLVPA